MSARRLGHRTEFLASLDDVLQDTAAIRRRAERLPADATRSDRLALAADLAAALARMADLYEEAAERLQAIRARKRTYAAYLRAAALRRSAAVEPSALPPAQSPALPPAMGDRI
ncbi:MAG: hypothetical protein KDA49_13665 [Rhodospirillaceae bacterium]|nr:hypothetical protein [Rhodospirillaceae bacterium]